MKPRSLAHLLLSHEARALLTRLERVKSFALQETMVPAAALSFDARSAIDDHMASGKNKLSQQVRGYMRWLDSSAGADATADDAQRRFTLLRLRFHAVLSQLDIFAEAMSQRSEADTGVWLAGLDAVARDALALPGYFAAPPVVCYLARGPGAAIRRARTRLPGGDENPVAVIRVPRERMIGSGLASSLIHEVGHQGAALLNLVPSLREELAARARSLPSVDPAFALWETWISEIVADFWAVARVGITATSGLIGVLSLPRAFVFRLNADDPHPMPYMRVLLSAALGKALYPHPQWDRLSAVWESYYPVAVLDPDRRNVIETLRSSLPAFVSLLIGHRPRALGHKPLAEVMATKERLPEKLQAELARWSTTPLRMKSVAPSLAFAVIGQARMDAAISPELESQVLADLLRHWALESAAQTCSRCASAGTSSHDQFAPKANYPAEAVH